MTDGVHEAIRRALQALPALAATAPGRPPQPHEIFFPEDHARAVDPETALVVGNRGMGKSFWANALAHADTRDAVSGAYERNLERVEARFVFASAEGVEHAVSKAELDSVPNEAPPEVVWRAAILPALEPETEVPRTLEKRVAWIQSHPEEQAELFRNHDRKLAGANQRLVLLFDALDQLADTWPAIQRRTEGLLKLALAMQSYRAIRIKIFMRPDQFESPDLFRFPDASKIKSGAVRLTWRAMDLYGLLFLWLQRECQANFLTLCKAEKINIDRNDRRHPLPSEIVHSEESQRRVFHRIAGPYMGKNEKRGFPYTWLPVHLADARREVAPRTFLHALRVAAHHTPAPTASAIDYSGIQAGVRKASKQRLTELQEDYPWVSWALAPLRRLLVPSDPDAIFRRWVEANVIGELKNSQGGAKGPLGVDLEGQPDDRHSLEKLRENLEAIGVMELRANGKVDIPDIFRVQAGILRKGGVTPQQRRRL